VKNYITDQRYALNLFGDGLIYTSEPFAEETELSGFPRLIAWMAMDVPDTDFEVNLYEIKPDGTSIALSGDVLRARYRQSISQPSPVKAGVIVRYEFNGFTFFSRKVARGSRLRLVLTSPNTINFEKNYNSGGNVEAETGKDARTAHITLYHDAQHASYLELPVVK
jgi:putative CocE/NonD family hydrolase